jgi:hypothetical protein
MKKKRRIEVIAMSTAVLESTEITIDPTTADDLLDVGDEGHVLPWTVGELRSACAKIIPAGGDPVWGDPVIDTLRNLRGAVWGKPEEETLPHHVQIRLSSIRTGFTRRLQERSQLQVS